MKKGIKEIVAIILILVLSVCLSTPSCLRYGKEYIAAQGRECRQNNCDGWIVSTPEAQNMDSEILSKADQHLEKTDTVSFLVIRNGRIVHEKYFNGFKAKYCSNLYSITHSFLTALTGIAVNKGYIKSIQQRIWEFYPSYYEYGVVSAKNNITIKHFLTMTQGFCENGKEWVNTKNILNYSLDIPVQYRPGKKHQYSEAAAHILSSLLTKATGQCMVEFADENIFTPLDIVKKEWVSDSQGNNLGFSDLYLTSRDIAKFGYLYLNNGKWKERQVLPAGWVKESLGKHVDLSGNYEVAYGYGWYIMEKGGIRIYSTSGYKGQSISIVPELNVIMVIATLPDMKQTIDANKSIKVLTDYIIPSINGTK